MNFCKDCKFHEFYAEHGWECTNENYRDSYTVTDPVRGVISKPKCDDIRNIHRDCQYFEEMEGMQKIVDANEKLVKELKYAKD